MVLLVPLYVSSRYCGFLPQSKHIQLAELVTKMPINVNVNGGPSLWVDPSQSVSRISPNGSWDRLLHLQRSLSGVVDEFIDIYSFIYTFVSCLSLSVFFNCPVIPDHVPPTCPVVNPVLSCDSYSICHCAHLFLIHLSTPAVHILAQFNSPVPTLHTRLLYSFSVFFASSYTHC